MAFFALTTHVSKSVRVKPGHTGVYCVASEGLYYAEMTMAKMDSVHFCRFKSSSPGKLIDTVIILFVNESFINVASDSAPGSEDALPAQDEEGVCLYHSQCAFAAARPLPAGVLAPWVKVSYSRYSQPARLLVSILRSMK